MKRLNLRAMALSQGLNDAMNALVSSCSISKQSNATLERLAHATTNKGRSLASPLQAFVRRAVGCNHSIAGEQNNFGTVDDIA